jgi:uncharacterized repeat protein (TIGR01451 family)
MSEPDRPSRQALVVPPRSSNLPLVTGIIASGAVGCGLVWGLTGRETRRGVANDAPAAAVSLLPHDLAAAPPTIDSRMVRPTSFQDEDTRDVSDQAPSPRLPSPDPGPPHRAAPELEAADFEPLDLDRSDPTPSDLASPDSTAEPSDLVPATDPIAIESRFPPPKEGVRFLIPVEEDDEPVVQDAALPTPRFAGAGMATRGLDDVQLQNVELEDDLVDRAMVEDAAVDHAAVDGDPLGNTAVDGTAVAGTAVDGHVIDGEVIDDEVNDGAEMDPPSSLAVNTRALDTPAGSSLDAPVGDLDAHVGDLDAPTRDVPFGDQAAGDPPALDALASPSEFDSGREMRFESNLVTDAAEPPAAEPPAPAMPEPAPPVTAPAPSVSPFAQAPPLVDPAAIRDPPAEFASPRELPPAVASPVPPQPAGPTGGLVPRFSSGEVSSRAGSPPPQPMAVAVSNPFTAAPPLAGGPAGGGYGGYDSEQPQAPPDHFAMASGQGRPGPVQLEGVQSPQLTVEKRGPREVQVGKPARYEVFVRNVGSAVANDVVLRDAVPVGTTLVTTTPPAMPGRAATGVPTDELVWPLGALPPGGQSRVVIELMPQTEGEIGSVASVTFRADASVRSRATRPALSIDCPTPDPVRIGGDALLRITVENPGTGVATGVVLEGFLPENVSHRSGRELEFDVGQLKPGETRSIELVLGTRGPGIHTARLVARADSGLEVERLIRLEVTAPTLELAVDMPVRRFLQRAATCEISMVNAGTATARSVELAAQLPPGLKFVRANNAGWHDERTHRVLWNLEELPAGETGAVEVVVMPVEHGPQKIVAAARSVDGLADQVAHVCEVEGLAALFFEVTDSEDPIEVNGVTEYIIRVGNQGTQAATGVRLVATLLGDLQPLAAQGPAGHRVENLTVAFEPLAKLAPSEEVVFRVRARGLSAGDQRVQVQLTSADHPAPITKEEVTRVYSDR